MTDNPPEPARDLLAFDPACPRQRIDGWTVDKQREFVEALADCGVLQEAAARVGMSEKSVSRLRRRADGASFSRACDAALRLARPIFDSIAWDRGVNGTIKQHFYHGELKGEERVYDNRLLTYLLGRLDRDATGPSTAELERDWSGIVDRLEDDPAPGMEADEAVWEEDGIWWTHFPPPEGFDGTEVGGFGDPGYRRHLSDRERAALDREEEDEMRDWLGRQSRRRDRFFGFAGGRDFSGHWQAGLSGPSGPFGPSGGDDDGAANHAKGAA
jgi:hypothetical protein